MTVNFRELLHVTSETVDRPRSAPECWLIGTLGKYEFSTTKNDTPKLSFDIVDIEAHPETPEEDLKGVNLEKLRSPYHKGLAVDYWITPAAKYMLVDMVDRILGNGSVPVDERIDDLRGERVMFKVTPQMNPDGTDSGQNNVDSRTVTGYSA